MAADNKLIKDGVGDTFTLRMKDISAVGDGSLQRPLYFATLYPIEYGAGGVFAHCARISLTAGIAADSPIWSFQWTSNTMLAVIRRIKLNVDVTATPFTSAATMHLDVYRAMNFTASDSGGTQVNFASGVQAMRQGMASSVATVMYGSPLTPGTRTVDPDPLDSVILPVPSTPSTIIGSNITLFSRAQGEHPLVLAQNSGLILRATAPAIGTWHCNVTCEWDEASIF